MKKVISIALLLLCSFASFSATRYWVGGHPTNNNWNQTGSGTTNWSATSGGAAGASVPGASDDVIFDGAGASGNSTSTISATITVLSFTVTSGYTSTITHNAVLTVAGNVTLNTSYTIAGSSALTISAASTITSGGKTWPNNLTFTNTNTKTLLGDFIVGGAVTFTGITTLNWTTNETLSCAGMAVSSATTGTAKIILTGGTWSGSGALQNNLDIAGNVTVSGPVAYNTGTLTYVSGTVTTTGSTLTIGASTTLNTAGITWNAFSLPNVGAITITLNSALTMTGTLTTSGASPFNFQGSFGFTCHTLVNTSTSGGSLTLNDGVTYTVTNALTVNTTRIGSIYTITSDHGSNTATLTLNQGATCNVIANFTRINASGGRTIRTWNGTVTGCSNVVSFTDIGTSRH